MTEPVRGVRQGAAALVTYRLGGRDYPLRSVAQCKVCRSPQRFHVETEIASGRTYTRIHKDLLLADESCDLTVENLRDHYKNGHMPLEVEASRAIIERRAVERGKDIQRGVDPIVDGMALAEIVVQKTVEAMQRGEIKPDMKDGLMAARLLETFAPVEQGADQNTYATAFMVYHETAQQIMTTSQFEEFGRQLKANPTLKALVARYSEGQVEPEEEPVSGEVVSAPREIALGDLDNGGVQG